MNKFESELYSQDSVIDSQVSKIEEIRQKIVSSQQELSNAIVESSRLNDELQKQKMANSGELKNLEKSNKEIYLNALKAYKDDLLKAKELHKANIAQLKKSQFNEQNLQSVLKAKEVLNAQLLEIKQEKIAKLANKDVNKVKVKDRYWFNIQKAKKAYKAVVLDNTKTGVIKKEKMRYEAELESIFEKHKQELLETKNKYLTSKKSISKALFIFIPILVVAVVIAVTLSLNYLVYLPNQDKDFNITDSKYLIAFAICMMLVVIALITSVVIGLDAKTNLAKERKMSMKKGILTGWFVGFLELFGIGAFAPTISISNAIGLIEDDKKIPGTLNAGYVLSVILQALIMIAVVEVDTLTLVSLIIASIVGSYLGATVANKVNKLTIKLIMSIVLYISAILMILNHPHIQALPMGDGATVLPFNEFKIYVAIFAFLVLGVLMSFGVGLYAPALVVISMLGMDGMAAYPIMMGACAFLMPVASFKFIKDKNYSPKLSVALEMGGILGTFTSYLFLFIGIKYLLGLPDTQFKAVLQWIVIVVIIYSAVTMTLDYIKITSKNREIKYRALSQEYKA
ncbi:sulfite exporter TauE/SafE family protein [Spiroplasma culicicola]|uniref:Probable membrane transporter protein n=1 Tax=Spiroplasma culicicola AES-1 TaxID=1276246 RepID=W6AHW0_9MOLU|nr:sulfite exporter TauE/SafE family protein [Spiroplasma culicicola]AHI53279.1 hypothetical protein SCULI_v1c09390 [Spiroplasma culicicola AES-1]